MLENSRVYIIIFFILQAAAPSKKKKVDEDTGPLMSLTIPKEQRFKDERCLKVSYYKVNTCISFRIDAVMIIKLVARFLCLRLSSITGWSNHRL